MKKTFLSVTITTLALTIGLAAQAQPRDYRDQRDQQNRGNHYGQRGHPPAQRDRGWHGGPGQRNWDAANHYQPPGRHQRERRLSRQDEIYRGHDGRYYCRRSDGTTGLVVGGVLGGLLGNAVGGDALSTLLGAAGGAALGNSIDRGQVSCR
jgi:hypothetical protein